MLNMTVIIGPPGSGKSTLARKMVEENRNLIYVNQDSQGSDGHIVEFHTAIYAGKDVVIDRMNFNKQQRDRYTSLAKEKGYKIKAIVKCESEVTCFFRMMARENHETIKDERSARGALQTFFTKYEPPEMDGVFDEIERIYPEGNKADAIVVDLDGTLCDIEHRRHFVRRTDGQKKDWNSFFKGIPDDQPNMWCKALVERFSKDYRVVFCSGRDTNQKKMTTEWLTKHMNMTETTDYSLFMRHRNDSRHDYLVKEILLDFEILTRFKPFFMVDDRQQVVDMWRRRGFVCLQCDKGDF